MAATAPHPNLDLLQRVARRLGSLRDELVFVGGAVTNLLISDPAAPRVRATRDVDVVVAVTSRQEYWRIEYRLRECGFVQAEGPDVPICRWIADGVPLDVMPTEATILGFANRWYPEVIPTAQRVALGAGLEIRVVTAPLFVATKLEAFRQRGGGDLFGSRDVEDVVAVVDGRPEIVADVPEAPVAVRAFVAEALADLASAPGYRDAVAGHLGPDADAGRLAVVLARLGELRGA